MPTESSKGDLDVVLSQKHRKRVWRGKGNFMCSSHKLSKMLTWKRAQNSFQR